MIEIENHYPFSNFLLLFNSMESIWLISKVLAQRRDRPALEEGQKNIQNVANHHRTLCKTSHFLGHESKVIEREKKEWANFFGHNLKHGKTCEMIENVNSLKSGWFCRLWNDGCAECTKTKSCYCTGIPYFWCKREHRRTTNGLNWALSCQNPLRLSINFHQHHRQSSKSLLMTQGSLDNEAVGTNLQMKGRHNRNRP